MRQTAAPVQNRQLVASFRFKFYNIII